MPIDIISAAIGLLLTVMIFSYLIGDTPLFRIAVYLFIGVSSGYAATVILYYVFIPKLKLIPLIPLDNPFQLAFAVIPWILGLSMLAKFFSRTAWIGNFAMAVLVGVGTAAAIGGALLGTVIPQFQASIEAFDMRSLGFVRVVFEGVPMFIGTAFTLAAFHFSAGRAADGTPRRPRILEGVAWVGRIFIAITLGVIFAGVYMAALTAMIERLSSIVNFFNSIRQWIGI